MLPWHLQRLSTHHPPVDPRAHRLAHSIGLLCGRSHSLADYSWNWGKVGLPHVSAQFHFPCLRTVVRRRAGTPGCQGCSSGSRRIVLDGNAPPPFKFRLWKIYSNRRNPLLRRGRGAPAPRPQRSAWASPGLWTSRPPSPATMSPPAGAAPRSVEIRESSLVFGPARFRASGPGKLPPYCIRFHWRFALTTTSDRVVRKRLLCQQLHLARRRQ